jgi:catechol 2,3-dioxygenase-like lactoylglutathione lyase family enzyme
MRANGSGRWLCVGDVRALRALLKQVDCVQIPVPNLDEGLRFYRDELGLELKWRHETQAGLRLGESELVLQTERPYQETEFLVDSADEAADLVEAAGGQVLAGPRDIPVGRLVVVADPFGNPLVLLDLSNGRFVTDDDGNVTGLE